MAEPVDPDATTSDTSESKDTILPENPAMPKARESIKVEQDSPKEIPVRSPASPQSMIHMGLQSPMLTT